MRKKHPSEINDHRSYQMFRTLFEEDRNVNRNPGYSISRKECLEEDDEAALTPEEVLLREFHAENRRLHLADCDDPAKQAAFDEMHQRLKQLRVREAELLARDPDAVALQAQQREAFE